MCTNGSSCLAELNYYVTYTGSSGGHNRIAVTPPACIAIPAGDVHAGSQAILSLHGDTAPVPEPTTLVAASTAPAAGPSPSLSVSASSSPNPTALDTPPATRCLRRDLHRARVLRAVGQYRLERLLGRGRGDRGGPFANCKPVPGAGGLAPSISAPLQVAFRAIQTSNG